MMNTIDPRQTSTTGIPNVTTDLLYRGPTGIKPFNPFELQPHNPPVAYPKDAKEFLERRIKELRELVRGLKSQLVNAENELYEHEKDLNKLVS